MIEHDFFFFLTLFATRHRSFFLSLASPQDLGRFKRITYDVLCQNTSARAERRRETHGGGWLR